MEPVCRIRTTPTREMDRQAYWPLLFHAKKAKFRFWLYNVIFIKGNPAMVFAKKGDTEGSPEQALSLLRGNGSIPT